MISFLIVFWDRFLERFGANLVPTWLPKPSQNGAKLASKAIQDASKQNHENLQKPLFLKRLGDTGLPFPKEIAATSPSPHFFQGNNHIFGTRFDPIEAITLGDL